MKSCTTRLLAPFVFLAAAGCGASAEGDAFVTDESELQRPPTVLKIGVLDDPSTTPLYGQAARLAALQVNQALAALRSNIRFELAFGDDQKNTPAIARSEALRLLNTERVLAIVSDSSGDTVQVNRLNYETASPAPYKFPVVCYQCSSGAINNPAATDADAFNQAALRDEQNFLFRIFYNANFEAKVLDQILVSKPNQGDRDGDGTLRISIYADGGHASLAQALGPTLSSYYSGATSVEIVTLSSIANLAAEWPRVVDGLNETTGASDGEPDYVILAMLPVNVAPAVQAYRTGGFTLPVLSNNSFRRNYVLAGLGSAAEGLEGSSVALANDNLSGQLFINAFKAHNAGVGPEQTSAGAYDATASLLLAALVASHQVGGPQLVTGASIRDALTKINRPRTVKIRPAVASYLSAAALAFVGLPFNYEGAYDSNDWDAVGDIFPPLVHWSVTNGAFVESESYLCNPANPLCPVQ